MDAVSRAAIGILIVAACYAASPEDDYQRGLDLARAGRWEDARAAFLAGQRQRPRDKRFALELAGVEYRRKSFAAAKQYLRRALRIDPGDRYGNDFLGTLYYREGNLEAALKYWNRVAKPRIDDVNVAPQPRVSPVLLDSALLFTPASVLSVDQLWTTEARLDGLGIFPAYRIELDARPEEHFDAAIHWLEVPAWMEAVSAIRGVAYQTLEPSLRNIGGTGADWDGMLRWDAQKRRAGTSLAGPLAHQAKWRYRWYADARSETWNTGASADFRLQRIASGIQFQAIPSWRTSWTAGAEVSTRHYGGLAAFPAGVELKYSAVLNYQLLRIPEHRFTAGAAVNWDLGRMLSGPDLFWQARISVDARWLPRARGDDYELNWRVRAGTTQGRAPLDELFMLGVERDNDLWLRGHAGTMDGKKGSAPIGRNYFLENWDFQKEIYRHSLFTLSAGPFIDVGRTGDLFRRPGFDGWLVDAGAEASIRVAGAFRISLVYGRDLRNGGHVIYGTALP